MCKYEDALAVLQASYPQEPHSLLCESAIVVDNEKPDEQPQESEDKGADEVTKSLGTLSVSDQGFSLFSFSYWYAILAIILLSFQKNIFSPKFFAGQLLN